MNDMNDMNARIRAAIVAERRHNLGEDDVDMNSIRRAATGRTPAPDPDPEPEPTGDPATDDTAALRAQVAAEFGLPDGFGARLFGDTLQELRADARVLAAQVAPREPVDFDGGARELPPAPVDMNESLRAARSGARGRIAASHVAEDPHVLPGNVIDMGGGS